MKIKHFSMLLTFGIILSLLCGSYFYMFCNRTDINIEIDKVEGDEAFLKDLSIICDIKDENHVVSFNLLNNSVKKSFTYGISYVRRENSFNKIQDPISVYYKYIIPNDANTKTVDVGDEILTYSDKFVMTINYHINDYDTKEITTGVVIKYPDMSRGVDRIINSHTTHDYKETKEYLETDNALYAVTYTDNICTGTGGVYKIASKIDNTYVRNDNPQNIFPIDLQEGKVRIIYGGTIGNKIVLVLSKNNILYMDVFDTEQNKLLFETKFGNEYSSEYFFNSSNDKYFILMQQLNNHNMNYFYVIDTSNGNIVEEIYLKSLYNFTHNEFGPGECDVEMLYKNNALYLLYNTYEDDYFSNKTYRFQKVKIAAYQNSKKKFECVLNSNIIYDVYEDSTFYRGSNRQFYNVKME